MPCRAFYCSPPPPPHVLRFRCVCPCALHLQIAVRRLLGSSRTLLATLLGIQVSLYAIPAWIIGLIIAQIMSRIILTSFRGSSGLPVQTRLTGVAVAYATGARRCALEWLSHSKPWAGMFPLLCLGLIP